MKKKAQEQMFYKIITEVGDYYMYTSPEDGNTDYVDAFEWRFNPVSQKYVITNNAFKVRRNAILVYRLINPDDYPLEVPT